MRLSVLPSSPAGAVTAWEPCRVRAARTGVPVVAGWYVMSFTGLGIGVMVWRGRRRSSAEGGSFVRARSFQPHVRQHLLEQPPDPAPHLAPHPAVCAVGLVDQPGYVHQQLLEGDLQVLASFQPPQPAQAVAHHLHGHVPVRAQGTGQQAPVRKFDIVPALMA